VDEKSQKTEEQRAVVPRGKASIPTKGTEVPRSRGELINELRPLIAQVNEGDEEAPHRIRRALEETPDSAQILSNIVAKRAERIFVGRICGDDLLLKEALSLQLQEMRKEVAGPDPSPLERLLAERVVACWLQLQHAEAAYAARLGKPTTSQDEYHQRRLDRVHRRYVAAIRSLAQVRKLLTPKVTQINLAQQQVNMVAKRLESDS
jgi:hypothetical protein